MADERARAREELANRLHSAAIHLLRRVRRKDTATELTGPRLSALSVIVARGRVSLGELAAAEQVKPPTMTRLVRALEAEGLVRRERDPDDARAVRLEATPRGRALFDEGRRRRIERLVAELDGIGEADEATLRQAVEALERVFGPPMPR